MQELAEDKLDGIADEYRAIGWHEVRATLDRPYDLYMKGSLYPATREPTEDEAARIEAIDVAIEQIAEAEATAPRHLGALVRSEGERLRERFS